MRIGYKPYLSLLYSKSRDLGDIIIDINGLQDLITLAVDSPTVPTEIKLWRSRMVRILPSGESAEVTLDAYWANAAEHVRQAKPRPDNLIFFFFDQMGGVKAVSRWVSVSRTYRAVLGSLLTIRYSQRLYQENRYSNVVSAAETLHRMLFLNEIMSTADFKSYRRKLTRVIRKAVSPKAADWLTSQLQFSNEPRLRGRLLELANAAGANFTDFVGDVETWASVVALVRNRLTHHDETQRIEYSPSDLDALTESIYVLTMLSLLRECEVSDAVLSGFQKSRRIAGVRRELYDVVPRLARYLRR
jgi:hypothetical protein